jgi:hypothetical protein
MILPPWRFATGEEGPEASGAAILAAGRLEACSTGGEGTYSRLVGQVVVATLVACQAGMTTEVVTTASAIYS